MDVNALEEVCAKASRDLFVKCVWMMQEWYQRDRVDQLERREWKVRHLLTRLGPVRLGMLKVRDKDKGRTFQLGNRLLGLGAREGATEWVKRLGVEFRVCGLTYRGAAERVGAMTGGRVSSMWVWRVVQQKGAERCRQERLGQREVFEGSREEGATPPEHLYLEADEIHVKAQRSGVNTHRVKVGLSYTGREEKGTGRVARRRLVGKQVYGGVESVSDFGRGWYSALERGYRISEVGGVLYLTDGDRWLRHLGEDCFPQAIHQLDWRHVFQDIRSGAPDERRRARWVDQLCSGKMDEALRDMKMHLRRGWGNAEALKKVVNLLEEQGAAFYGWKEYRRRHDPEKEERLPRGTGGIEKNQEVTIGRTMKRRGMAWTRKGANHLAKLVFAWQNRKTWQSLWRTPLPP
jgi:hypothetical protein